MSAPAPISAAITSPWPLAAARCSGASLRATAEPKSALALPPHRPHCRKGTPVDGDGHVRAGVDERGRYIGVAIAGSIVQRRVPADNGGTEVGTAPPPHRPHRRPKAHLRWFWKTPAPPLKAHLSLFWTFTDAPALMSAAATAAWPLAAARCSGVSLRATAAALAQLTAPAAPPLKGPPVFVFDGHVCARADQRGHYVAVAIGGSKVQRRLPAATAASEFTLDTGPPRRTGRTTGEAHLRVL
jgi:hypothetical protein